MINSLPKSLVESAVKHIFAQTVKYKAFTHFNCDNDIKQIAESLDDTLYESLDSRMVLHDVTDLAKEQEPDTMRDPHGITDFKVEYSIPTRETITTYKRDGAWEIHHQRESTSGNMLGGKSPAMKFVSHMHTFIKDKISRGEPVRISSSPELITHYHKLATHLVNKMDNTKITDIHPGTDIHRLGVPIHEFLIHPALHETFTPWFLLYNPSRMKFVKETFGLTEEVIEYEEKLRKQGHQIDSLIESATDMLNQPRIDHMSERDIDRVLDIESQSGTSAWTNPHSFFDLDKPTSVVRKGNAIVGFFITKKNGDATHLVKLGVDEPHKHTGVASMVMNHLKDKHNKITLNVRSSNIPAIKLYEKHGFQHVEEKPGYYTDGSSAYSMQYEKNKK